MSLLETSARLSPEAFHSSQFKRLLSRPFDGPDRAFVEGLWARFEGLAEPQFTREFAEHTHSRYWEMYVGVALLDMGCSLAQQRRGPDLCVDSECPHLWIEATAPEPGTGEDRVPSPRLPRDGEVIVENWPEEVLLLRYTSKISDKSEQYEKWLARDVIRSDEPFVIAINGGDLYYSSPESEIPNIVKAAFGIGPFTVTIDNSTEEVVSKGYGHRPYIRKRNGELISTKFFLEQQNAGISGILFSNVNLWNPMNQLGADFIFVHNPYAKNPVRRKWLQRGREYWTSDGLLWWD